MRERVHYNPSPKFTLQGVYVMSATLVAVLTLEVCRHRCQASRSGRVRLRGSESEVGR